MNYLLTWALQSKEEKHLIRKALFPPFQVQIYSSHFFSFFVHTAGTEHSPFKSCFFILTCFLCSGLGLSMGSKIFHGVCHPAWVLHGPQFFWEGSTMEGPLSSDLGSASLIPPSSAFCALPQIHFPWNATELADGLSCAMWWICWRIVWNQLPGTDNPSQRPACNPGSHQQPGTDTQCTSHNRGTEHSQSAETSHFCQLLYHRQ